MQSACLPSGIIVTCLKKELEQLLKAGGDQTELQTLAKKYIDVCGPELGEKLYANDQFALKQESIQEARLEVLQKQWQRERARTKQAPTQRGRPHRARVSRGHPPRSKVTGTIREDQRQATADDSYYGINSFGGLFRWAIDMEYVAAHNWQAPAAAYYNQMNSSDPQKVIVQDFTSSRPASEVGFGFPQARSTSPAKIVMHESLVCIPRSAK